MENTKSAVQQTYACKQQIQDMYRGNSLIMPETTLVEWFQVIELYRYIPLFMCLNLFQEWISCLWQSSPKITCSMQDWISETLSREKIVMELNHLLILLFLITSVCSLNISQQPTNNILFTPQTALDGTSTCTIHAPIHNGRSTKASTCPVIRP